MTRYNLSEPRQRAIGRLNDYLSTLPVSRGRSQALVDLNVILTTDLDAARAAAPLDARRG